MKSGQVQVIGIVTIVKDDKISYVVHGFTPFEDWEIEKGCEGYKTFNEYTRCDMSKVNINDIIEPIYSKGFKGQAVMSSYRNIKTEK